MSILEEYNSLDPENRKKSLNAWRPVIYSIISAVNSFPDQTFEKHLGVFYEPIAGLILQVYDQALREALHAFFIRCANCLLH